MKSQGPKWLFVGPLFYGSTAEQRLRALREVESVVAVVDTTRPLYASGFKGPYYRLLARIAGRLSGELNNRIIVRKVIQEVKRSLPQLIWIDRSLVLNPQHIRELRRIAPHLKIIYFTPDDMLNPNNDTRRFIECLSSFDFTVTTKSFHVEELARLGSPRVHFVDNAYDSRDHRPPHFGEAASPRPYDVAFVGGYEAERAASLIRIANTGVSVHIVSWDFPQSMRLPPNVCVDRRFLVGNKYAQCIWNAKINLGFLRKANRDLQTTRSIEIPACGGFMLAERTEEHRRLFREGLEAAYFDSEAELLVAIQTYLKNPQLRERIAEAGRARVLSGRYDYRSRITDTLESLGLREAA